jgi:hypothetical protein
LTFACWCRPLAFRIENGRVLPGLTHIRHIAGVVTEKALQDARGPKHQIGKHTTSAPYGRPRLMAWWVGDPPRRIVTRYLFWLTGRRARLRYLAHEKRDTGTNTLINIIVRKVFS